MTDQTRDNTDAGKKSLQDAVRDWFDEHGYPLEMATARAWRRGGFTVHESEHYRDNSSGGVIESGEVREIDALATFFHDFGGKQLATAFTLECKSGDKPWVLLAKARSATELPKPGDRCPAGGEGHELLKKANVALRDHPLFSLPDRVAYGVKRGLVNGKEDVPYGATFQAVKAAKFWAWNLINSRKQTGAIVFPVVVIDAPLLQAWIDDAGEVHFEEVSRGVLLWRNPVISDAIRVDIVTVAALEDFAKRAHECCKMLGDVFYNRPAR